MGESAFEHISALEAAFKLNLCDELDSSIGYFKDVIPHHISALRQVIHDEIDTDWLQLNLQEGEE